MIHFLFLICQAKVYWEITYLDFRIFIFQSTVCKRIMEKLGQVDKDHDQRQVVCISQDSFYKDLSKEDKMKAEKGQFNFDHPDAFDDSFILRTLEDIRAGIKCEIPAYDYRTNSLYVCLFFL